MPSELANWEHPAVPAYIPFAGKNSIVEVVIGLQFALPITDKIAEKFGDLKNALIADFPSFEKAQVFQFILGSPNAVTAPSPVSNGFTASKYKSNGKQSRVLRGTSNTLSVHFLEYEHWSETKTSAIEFLDRCIKILGYPSTLNAVNSVNLTYLDRFTFDGDPNLSSAIHLLKPTTTFVPAQILSAGSQWHSNSGWFDTAADGTQTLNNLLVQSAIEENSVVLITHNMLSTPVAPIASIGDLMSGRLSMTEILEIQHTTNTNVLKNLLLDSILDEIGMN